MRKFYFLAILLVQIAALAQNTVHKYYMYLSSSMMIPKFTNSNNNYTYLGNDAAFNNFISGYNVLKFEQAFPSSTWEHISRVAVLETTSADLAENLIFTFPSIFLKYEDRTNFTTELLYAPDDYGTSSPNPYNGDPVVRKDLDYIKAQKAWDYSTGINAQTGNPVKIGISDSKIIDIDSDFLNVTWVEPSWYQNNIYNPNILETYHGTNSAGIAAAKGNNSHKTTGICYNCDILAANYGQFNSVIKLAQAGARVINMSWILSMSTLPPAIGVDGFFQVHQDIITQLIQDNNAVFVAAAGNTSSFQTTANFHNCGNF